MDDSPNVKSTRPHTKMTDTTNDTPPTENSNPPETPSGDCGAMPCSRFAASRVEELLQASNDLSEGDEISYDDARDLALYALDELERVRNIYQSRFMDIANAAVSAMRYPPENADGDGRSDSAPPSQPASSPFHPPSCSMPNSDAEK